MYWHIHCIYWENWQSQFARRSLNFWCLCKLWEGNIAKWLRTWAGGRLLGFKFSVLLTEWLWTNWLTSLCFSFLTKLDNTNVYLVFLLGFSTPNGLEHSLEHFLKKYWCYLYILLRKPWLLYVELHKHI